MVCKTRLHHNAITPITAAKPAATAPTGRITPAFELALTVGDDGVAVFAVVFSAVATIADLLDAALTALATELPVATPPPALEEPDVAVAVAVPFV